MANKATKQTKPTPEYKVQHVEINSVKSNADNPRIIKDDKFKKLVKSISEFPQMLELRPIIVDNDMVILGGNMRHKAAMECGLQMIPIVIAEDLTEEQKKEFIIKDNVGFGEWDWDILANDWDSDLLIEWGLDIKGFSTEGMDIGDDGFGTEFELPSGEKSPFQQITYTLANEQAVQVKNAIEQIKQTEEYKYCETMGNENSNGNALYLLVMQWMQMNS